MRRLSVCLLVLALFGAGERAARACGVSAGGAPGLCSVEEHQAELRRWRLGAGVTFASTQIQFTNNQTLPSERVTVVATLDRQVRDRFVIQLGAGALVKGSVGDQAMRGGGLFAVSGAWRVLDQPRFGRPFMLVTLTFAGLVGATSNRPGTDVPYAAFDFRLGGVLGTRVPLGRRASFLPYVVGRLFGGPIFWKTGDETVLGTDAYKHQLGGGATLTFDRFDLFVELIGVGERAMSAGLGGSF